MTSVLGIYLLDSSEDIVFTVLKHCAIQMYISAEVELHAFLMSSLDGAE
jgi:hypothetical protein